MKYYKVFEPYIGLAGEEEELWHITTEKPYDGGVKRGWSRKQETTIEEPIPALFEELTEEEALVAAIETYTEYEDDNTRRQTIQFQHSILDMLEEIEFFFDHFDKELTNTLDIASARFENRHAIVRVDLYDGRLRFDITASKDITSALGEYIEATAYDNDVPCEVAK